MVKTKVRFDGLDVASMVAHWNRVALGRRVINIYNGPNGDTYLFKLDKQRGGDEEQNLLLIIESGIRFHSTKQSYDNPGMPTPFCAKLRKHLRGLRLENVQQLGNKDRVVNLVFGSGETQRHSILLELYARGNIILTNSKYQILALLRSHEYGNTNDNNNTTTTTTTTNSNKEKGKDSGNNNSNDSIVKVQVGHAYPVTYATTTTLKTAAGGSSSAATDGDGETEGDNEGNRGDGDDNGKDVETLLSAKNPLIWYRTFQQQQQMMESQNEAAPESSSSSGKKQKQKKKKKGGDGTERGSTALKSILMKPESGVSHYGPSLIDHCLAIFQREQEQKTTTSSLSPSGDDHVHANATTQKPNMKLPTEMNEEEWMTFQSILSKEGGRILHNLEIADDTTKGYILYQPKKKLENDEEEKDNNNDENDNNANNVIKSQFDNKLLLEFQPHLLQQHIGVPYIEYDSFDRAVDTFFSHIEGQKRLLRAETQEQQAKQRLEKVRLDQQQRVDALMEQQDVLKCQAQLVELHADMVEKAIQVVNSALDSGMDWDQLDDLVQIEKYQNRNPVALLIHTLDLEKDSMTLRLAKEEYMYENIDTDELQTGQYMDISISLKETAHGNASSLFAKYRSSKEKSQKTIEASTKALQAAEENAQKQLDEVQKRLNNHQTSSTLSGMMGIKRKPLWFEKFHWFITSDNYLVIAGRDAQQNEQLVKRYLRPGDAYLHADVHGAASCILRAKRRRQKGADGRTTPIPLSEQALREAGHFTICRSSAWNSRMVTSAWWVESHQVSKTAPSGEYLTVGSFMIRGKKNFLPPTPLEMGLGILFRLGDDDQSTMMRHKNERRDFALLQMEQDEEAEDDELIYEQPQQQNGGNKNKKSNKNNNKVLENNGDENDDEEEDELLRGLESDAPMPMSLRTSTTQETTSASPVDDDNDDDETSHQPSAAPVVVNPNTPNDEDGDNNDEVFPEGNVDSVQQDDDPTATPAEEEEEENEDKDTKKGEDDKPEVLFPPKKNKKGLSARDRKLIKKYGSLEAAEKAEEERKRIEAEAEAAASKGASSKKTSQVAPLNQKQQQQQQQQQQQPKRGKKAKMKKMARKYADQDDEDRELAMFALQGTGDKDSKKRGNNKNSNKMTTEISQKEKDAAAETMAILKKDSSIVAEKLPEPVKTALAKCVTVVSSTEPKWEKFDADVLEQLLSLESEEAKVAAAQRLQGLMEVSRIDNFSASLAGIIRTIRKYGHEGLMMQNQQQQQQQNENNNDTSSSSTKRKTKAQREAEEESWKKTLAAEGGGGGDENDDDDDDYVDDTAELNKLSGKPHPEDLILFAIPVCAPYHTLSQYTYRVKLTPGNLKRGKASKQCIEMFLRDGGNANSGQGQSKSQKGSSSSSSTTSSSTASSTTTTVQGEKRNKDCIKRVPDNEWVQAICGDVKISSAGASKLLSKQKQKNNNNKNNNNKSKKKKK